MSVSTSAVPHDLLKPVCWKMHANPGRVAKIFGTPELIALSRKFLCPDFTVNGSPSSRELYDAIRGHHADARFWERCLAVSDRLAAAVGRLRAVWRYWEPGEENIFLVKLYVREGPHVIRPRVGCDALKDIISILRKHSRSEDAFRELNDYLSRFPADSRFPLVSLKTHHWLSDALRRSKSLRRLCSARRNPERMGLIRVGVPCEFFHRLRDLRAFRDYVDHVLRFIEGELASHLPLRVGDELFLAAVEGDIEDLVNRLTTLCIRSALLLKMEIHEWRVGRAYGQFIIESLAPPREAYIGEPKLPEFAPKATDAWAEELERSERVLWMRVALHGALEEVAKTFLDRVEREILSRMPRRPEENPIEQKISLSPDLLVSISDGLGEFYMDFGRILSRSGDPKEVTVLRSLRETIFVRGLRDGEGVLELYEKALELLKRILIEVDVSGVMCSGKYPFWRVYELLKSYDWGLIVVRGDRLVRLGRNDVPDLIRARNLLSGRNVSRSQFMEIIKEARRSDGPEILKVLIESRDAEGKLLRGSRRGGRGFSDVCRELCRLVDRIYQRHRDMKAVAEALELLMPYTKAEGGR
ncbi:hypothetical protein DRN52_06020 [Thermococci archaeon]|nr:MAG: hypothetical protein DRN52_06020 [Thermococci archaeon]